MPVAPRPETVLALVADLAELVTKTTDNYLWLHGNAHSKGVRDEPGPGGRGGHSDPTAVAVLDDWNTACRAAMVNANRRLKRARAEALAAYREIAKAFDGEPEHPYSEPIADYTTRDAMTEVQKAAARRRRRGQTHGEG